MKYRRRILAARRLAAATAILWLIQGAFAADTPPATDAAPVQQPLAILGKTVAPMTTELLYWTPGVAFDGNSIPRGVIVANGANPGPVLCLTAVVHGDEHNGLEIVRRVLYELDPAHLSGAVIGVPIVNLDGFRRGTRYLPDRRDLNRFFPGKQNGGAAGPFVVRRGHSVV